MKHPHTPLLRMERQKPKAEIHNFLLSKKYQDLKKSLEVPKETTKNHVLVGGVGLDYSYSVYNPHNARFYFNFDRSSIKPMGGGVGLVPSNGSELKLDDFMSCRVVIKKTMIEITNKINKDRCFKISGSEVEIDNQIKDAVATLEREAIGVLRAFVDLYGGKSDFVCCKVWIPDNKILHDRIIDSIPDEVTFRNDVIKKVYNELPKNVEVSTPTGASKLLRNHALFEFSPMIANELADLKSKIEPVVIVKEVVKYLPARKPNMYEQYRKDVCAAVSRGSL